MLINVASHCWEAALPLPNAFQEGELFLLVQPRRYSDHAAHSQASALLPHRSTAKSIRHYLKNGMDFLKFRLWAPLLLKTWDNHLFSFSQWMVSGKSFSCANLSVLLSFSLFFLCNRRSLSSTAPVILFSSKSTHHSSYLLQCDHLAPSKCSVCSPSPQTCFFGVQSNLTFI